ncbi:hypothetical protein RhiLY_08018 [Ceratobasidium sp. AG-Ba]|nr:hypothetical protein RhiLY_08018 [Ceratobasidium sp. AG-Ba]
MASSPAGFKGPFICHADVCPSLFAILSMRYISFTFLPWAFIWTVLCLHLKHLTFFLSIDSNPRRQRRYFRAEFRKVRECANSDKEPGCIEFRTSRSGDRFLAFEQYENLESFKAVSYHAETDVFKAFVGVVKDLHARPPVVLFYEELSNPPQNTYKSKM